MKKYFISMAFLFAVAAGMTVVSCDDKKDAETKYTAEQQQNKIDETGEAFIAELDLANWKETADLAVPGIMGLQEVDLSDAADIDIEARTYEVDRANKLVKRTYQIDMTAMKGHFTLDDDFVATKDEGNFDDFKLSFSAEEHAYVVDIKFTNSKKNVLISSYDDTTYGYYDKDGEWQELGETYDLTSKTYLRLPEKLEAFFTVDGSKTFTLTGTLSYDGPEDLSEMPDFKTLSVAAGCTVSAGGYTVSLDQLSYKKGTAKEVFALKHGKKLLLEVNSSATGLGLAEDALKSPEDGEPGVDGEYEGEDGLAELAMIKCDKAELSIDVLGQLQVKGFVKYNDLIAKLMDMPEIETAEAANAWLLTLKPYYSLGLYYDHGSSAQATIVPVVDQEKGFIPTIVFADGTSYAVDEFFTPDNFGKTYAALQAFVSKVDEYFESLNASDDSQAEIMK